MRNSVPETRARSASHSTAVNIALGIMIVETRTIVSSRFPLGMKSDSSRSNRISL